MPVLAEFLHKTRQDKTRWRNPCQNLDKTDHEVLLYTCAGVDPDSFVSGGTTLTTFFVLRERERIQIPL